jgi:hypothetical protein
MRQTIVASATYTVSPTDDILLCSIVTTIIFPIAKNGREIEVVMTGVGDVTVNLAGTDLIYGETSVLLNVQGMALHFKAITGGWILI